jgi:uncharacterized protein with HEPN domain
MRDEVRTARLSIYDMLDAIDIARRARAELTFEQFEESLLNRLAAERAIEIISEASRRIPETSK